MQARPATPEERAQALEILFQHHGIPIDVTRRRIDGLLQTAGRGGLDLSGLFVAEDRGRIVGAGMAFLSPGHTAMVFPARGGAGGQAAEAVMTACRQWASRKDATLLQALIDPADEQAADCLRQAGYEFLADITYMERAARHRVRGAGPRDDLTWETYGPANRALFQKVVDQTYEGSEDCPKLQGLRRTEDVLEGHKAEGKFSPDLWFVARQAGRPVGCLLLAQIPEAQSLDVVYMGLTPDARGQGLGRQLLIKALSAAEVLQTTKVTLAVDQQNGPAVGLYRSMGFRIVTRRAVYGRRAKP